MKRTVVWIVCLSLVAPAALAVKPATWTHRTEADFSAGKLEKTVVTSLAEVMLARALDVVVAPSDKPGMVCAIALDRQGRLYVAASPPAKVYRLEKDKLVEFAELPGVLVPSLIFARGKLIAGTAGKGAGVYEIDGKGKVKALWTDAEVKYVWSVVPGPRGSFYAATGAEGKVFHVRPDGKADVIYDSDEKNVLSLVGDGEGLLYAGTGENGLVIRIDPARRVGRVLYDAPEKEISALLVDGDGVLYAATADAAGATATGEVPSKEVKGKPDSEPKAEPATPAGKAAPETRPRAGAPGPTPPAKAAVPATAPAPGKQPSSTQPAPTTGPVAPAASGEAPSPKPAQTAKVGASKPGAPSRPSRPPVPAAVAAGKGNAVYRIDRDGFVRAVFRRPVTILAMTMHQDKLTIGTGHGGQIFTIEPEDDRISVLVKVDPKDVTTLAVGGKGELYVGTADKAGIFAVKPEFAGKGTCTSKVLDGKQISRWGTLSVRADVPADCRATIATRSGNVAKPDEKTWSSWSAETPVSGQWTAIGSPAGRFLQYRLTLSSEGKATASVDQVRLVHQGDNLAPAVQAVQAIPNHKPGRPDRSKAGDKPLRYRIIMAKAADPNGDDLQYAVHFRRDGHKRWIQLAEKLTEPLYSWDTLGVGDGSYQIRVTVSDARANPPATALTAARISRPVIVDNSPPRVVDLAVKPAGKGKVSLAGKIADATSRIRTIEYSVDTNDEWTVITPDDGICDSQRESFSATIDQVDAGAHRIAVRVADELSNTGYASVEVTVGK